MAARTVAIDIIARDKASAAFRSAGEAAQSASKRLESAGKKLTGIGSTLSTHLSLPIAAAATASVKMAGDFQSAMEKVHTQAGGSQKDVAALSNQVLGLAKYAEQGPTELADAMYHLKSVGMDNATAMRTLRQASDLAAVGGSNLEDTTNALAGAWRSGIKGATNMHTAVSTLNAIIGSGNMRMSDLVSAIGTGFLPTARTFGLSLKDMGSALALMTDEGVPATDAATRLRMTISLLGAPSKKAAAELGHIGLTNLSLAQDMRKPNGLITAIGDLKKHLQDSGMTAVQQSNLLSQAFGGGRSSAAILTMVNNFGVLQQKQDQITKGMGRFDGAVQAQRKTAQAQFALVVSSLQRAAIMIGNALLPTVTKIARFVGQLAERFNNLSPGMKRIILIVAGIVAVLGPLLVMVGTFITVIGALISPITLVVLGLIALAAVVLLVYKNWGRISAFFIRIGNTVLGTLKTWGKAALNALTSFFGIPQFISTQWHRIVTFLRQVWNLVVGTLKTWGKTALDALTSFFGIPQYISHLWNQIVGFLRRVANTVWPFLKTWGPVALAVLSPFIGIPLLIFQHWRQIIGFLRQVWNGATGAVKSGVNTAVRFVEKLPGRILDALAKLPADLRRFAAKIFMDFVHGAMSVNIGKLIGDFLHGAVNKALGFLGIHLSSVSASPTMFTVGEKMMTSWAAGIAQHARKVTGAVSGVSGAAGSVASNSVARLAQTMAAARGWVGGQWAALNNVAMRESGWSMTARNPSSGAYGVAQFINGPGEYAQWGGNVNTAAGQVTAFLNYIASRYGTPSAAWQHELSFGWYDRGGFLARGLNLALNTTGHAEPVGAMAGRGPAVNIEHATFVDQADIKMLMTQAEFAVKAKGF